MASYARCRLGEMRRLQGRYTEALDLFSRALKLFRAAGNPGDEAVALVGLARCYRCLDDLAAAWEMASSARDLAIRAGWPFERAEALTELGHVFARRADSERAADHWQAALELFVGLGVPETDEVRRLLGEVQM
jgi:tetratricopeptide (TPR) repeat protein